MVQGMISSGHDRQHFQEIVDKYVDIYTDNDALLESTDFLDDEEEFIAEMQEESGIGEWIPGVRCSYSVASNFVCLVFLYLQMTMRRSFSNTLSKKFPRHPAADTSRDLSA